MAIAEGVAVAVGTVAPAVVAVVLGMAQNLGSSQTGRTVPVAAGAAVPPLPVVAPTVASISESTDLSRHHTLANIVAVVGLRTVVPVLRVTMEVVADLRAPRPC